MSNFDEIEIYQFRTNFIEITLVSHTVLDENIWQRDTFKLYKFKNHLFIYFADMRFNQEMECKVVLAKLTNRRDKKICTGSYLVNSVEHVMF